MSVLEDVEHRLFNAAEQGDTVTMNELLAILYEKQEQQQKGESDYEDLIQQTLSKTNERGYTILHVASLNGHHHIVDTLVRYDCFIDPLVSLPSTTVIKQNPLINLPENITLKCTPLVLAVLNNHLLTVKCLVQYGANLNFNTSFLNDMDEIQHSTPINLSKQLKHEKIEDYFESHLKTLFDEKFVDNNNNNNNNDSSSSSDNNSSESVYHQTISIGVCGPTCSGKSTLTRSLMKYYRERVRDPYLRFDSYWKKFGEMPRKFGFVNGESIEALRVNDFKKALIQEKNKFDGKFILAEGFLLFCEAEIVSLLSLKIFVKISRETCWKRRSTRNLGTPRRYFDLVIWPEYSNYCKHFLELETMDISNTSDLELEKILVNGIVVLDGEKSEPQLLDESVRCIDFFLKIKGAKQSV